MPSPTSPKWSAVFGDAPLLGDAELPSTGVIGVYFSAHWCGPCRGFTPKLVENYTAVKKAGHAFEIVFASSDQDDDAFTKYFADMPWLALPFADRARKETLSKVFGVEGIPTLVLLDAATGAVISTDGRDELSGDADDVVAAFPWAPKTTFTDEVGQSVLDAVSADVFGLYFSAHWCPPCKHFTPKLAETYKKINGDAGGDKKLEILFVSSDRDEEAFAAYSAEMPWPALDFAKRDEKAALSKRYGVTGIPSLVFVDKKTGKAIVENGRAKVDGDPEGKTFPDGWLAPPGPVADVDDDPSKLNDDDFEHVIAICPGLDAMDARKVSAAMETLVPPPGDADDDDADEKTVFDLVAAAATGGGEAKKPAFWTSTDTEGRVSTQLFRLFGGLKPMDVAETARLVRFCPPAYQIEAVDGTLDAGAITGFLDRARAGEIETKSLG